MTNNKLTNIRMTAITREQLHERARRKVKELEFAITQSAFTSIRDGLNEELELARIALAALTAEPVSQTYELPELIEGMEVSVDVSTCDFDAGHRYFGTVTEVSELDSAKSGYILLVQDAEPNFDVNGNSPATTDGWISCSERMPDREYVLAGDFSGTHYLASIPNVQVGIYADWFDDEKPCWDDGDGNDLHLKEVTHWMPLPAPQQEVK